MYYGLLLLLLNFSNSRVMFPDRVESKNCKHCLFSRKSPLSFPTYCILLNGLYFYWVTLTNYTKINAGTIHGMNTREMEFNSYVWILYWRCVRSNSSQMSTFNFWYFLCNEFRTFFEMLEFNLWHFWKMSGIHYKKYAGN